MPALLADENLDSRIVAALRAAGYSVASMFEDYRSISDAQLIELANRQDRVIVTEDKDFGELTCRLKIANRGIVLLRLSGQVISEKVRIVLKVFTEFDDWLYGNFTVIKADRVRIRELSE